MPDTVSRTELSPVSFLRKAAIRHAAREAVWHEGRSLTYAQLAERVDRLSAALQAAGIQPGDRVAALCLNTPALLECHFAVPAVGALLVAINTRLTGDEIGYILGHSRAKILFVDAELRSLLDGVDVAGLHLVVVEDTGAADDPYERMIANAPPVPDPAPDPAEDDLLAINYTSGTTGRPKGVAYTHRGAYLAALAAAAEMRLTADSSYLWTLPMFHCNGWCFPWAVTSAGARHVCLRKVDAAHIWELIDQQHVSHYSGAPIVSSMVAAHPRAHRVEPPLTVGLGGAPPSPVLLRRLLELNVRPLHFYGLTETLRSLHHRQRPRGARDPARRRARRPARPPGPGLPHRGPGPRRRHTCSRRAARRRHPGRGRHARQYRHGGLRRRPRGHRACLP